MSNSSTSKRPIGPVRQHSLPQPPRHQRQIRRQKSTENERNLKSYSTSSTSFRDRFTDNSNTCHSPTLVRPKVRVAWSEQSVKSKKDDGVEIIAHQIKTSKFNRSAAGRDNKAITGRYSLAEKSPILYSRQDLEERLKLAWRQREENKSNIDIFLAHNTVGERCDSGMSADTNPTAQSTPKSHKKVRNSGKLQPNDDQTTNEAEDTRKDKSEKKITEGHDCDTRFPARRSMERPVYESQHVNDNSVSIRASEGNVKRSFISINCRNWNTEMSIKSKEDVISDEEGKGPSTILSKEADYSQARVRRANYQNGTSKAFAGPILEKSSLQKCTSRDKQSPDERGRLRRTSSAPPQRRAQANVVQSTSGMPVSSSGPEEDRWPMKVKEEKRPRVKSCMIGSRPIKSASAVKRRSKANKRRGISVTCTKDGDGETGPESARGKGRSVNVGNTFLGKSADVVTMVSLVSSADSDSEMDEISLKDDELICKLRNKLPRTPIIKSSNCLSSRNRKPFKSVSFQQDSVDLEDSPLRTDQDTQDERRMRYFTTTKSIINGFGQASTNLSPLPIFWRSDQQISSVHAAPSLGPIEVTLTDREKRCLAVPIDDVRDKKPRLLRCRSAVTLPKSNDSEKQLLGRNQSSLQAGIRIPQMTSPASVGLLDSSFLKMSTNPLMPTTDVTADKHNNLVRESYCQTPKEKECWHLYRRMCDKGVFVSFDTVLRGMLTPTEYRLRQKEMSQNCLQS